MQHRKVSEEGTVGTDSDGDADLSVHSAMHSAATTQPSSPRPLAELLGPCTATSLPWEKIRQRLFQLAVDGDPDVDCYGDIISDRGAIERFLSAAKGNIDKATEQMRAHLHWRRSYKVEEIVHEDFSDMKAHNELYWAGKDNQGVPTMTWILRKHDAKRVPAERFVRFLVHQIEVGMRASPEYPNTPFNIIVDLGDVGLGNNDPEMASLLQTVLVQNYPKVRKSLFVFPVNWIVHLFWDTIIKPILSTLQPDIDDKICPLTGDFQAKLKERFPAAEIEIQWGGDLDVSARGELSVLPYSPVSVSSMLRPSRPVVSCTPESRPAASPSTTLRAAQKLAREEQRVRRKEATQRQRPRPSETNPAPPPSTPKAGWGASGRVLAVCAAVCAGLLWAPDCAPAALSAALASAVAIAVVGAVGLGRPAAGGGAVRDDKAVVARVAREREARTPWLGRYAQTCGF